MNILLYSHAFPPRVGGVETISMTLASELPRELSERLGEPTELTVVTQTPDVSNGAPSGPGQAIIRRPGTISLWRLVGRADVMLLAGPALLPMLFGLLRSKPILITHHGYQAVCPNGLLFHLPSKSVCPGHFQAKHYGECVRCCARESNWVASLAQVVLTFPRLILCKLASRNISVSKHAAGRLGLPSSVVIRNGVYQTACDRLEIADNGPAEFLFVGRMVAEKGIEVLIRAAEVLKKRCRFFRVLLAGDGPERRALEELSSRAGLEKEVLFLGFKTGTDRQNLLERRSVCVVPSIWEETAGLSAVEQMMAGKPVIASDIGGLSEEIGNCGVLFAPGNALALADAMEEFIANPQLGNELGARARQRAIEYYGLSKMVQHYADLLQSLQARSNSADSVPERR